MGLLFTSSHSHEFIGSEAMVWPKARTYRKTSIISGTLIGNKIVYHSDIVAASAVGAAQN